MSHNLSEMSKFSEETPEVGYKCFEFYQKTALAEGSDFIRKS